MTKVKENYPDENAEQPRVVLAQGILSVDGEEIDRYKSPRSLFLKVLNTHINKNKNIFYHVMFWNINGRMQFKTDVIRSWLSSNFDMFYYRDTRDKR